MVTEFEYLLAHPAELEKYVGLWVGVVGDKIVASGESAKEVYEKAHAAFPGREPFLMKVPRERVLVL
ncbi:MAG TPA: DUF5678 domain-containing protein [Thermoplasmata archaeon]|nr:DUF5678 domain-containing protein [Thermoplasmata archaeon]